MKTQKLLFRDFVYPLLIVFLMITIHFQIFSCKGFYPKDDGIALLRAISIEKFHNQIHQRLRVTNRLFDYIIYEFNFTGRVRPLWHIIQYIEVQLFKKNCFAWQMETLLLGIITCIFLFFIFILLGFNETISFLGVFVYIFRIKNLYCEKHLQEAFGMLFIIFAIFFFIKSAKKFYAIKYDVLGSLFIILASLTKESFILVIPALLIIRVYLTIYYNNYLSLTIIIRRLRYLLGINIFFFIIFLIIAYISFKYTSGSGYAGRVVDDPISSFNLLRWGQLLYSEKAAFLYFIPIAGYITFFLKKFDKKNFIHTLFIGLIFSAWLLPQLLLYSKSGFNFHYFFPAILSVITINLIGLKFLLKFKYKIIYWTFVVLSLLISISEFPKTHNFIQKYVATDNNCSDTYTLLFSLLKKNENGAILYAPQRAWWAWGISLLAHMSINQVHTTVYLDTSYLDPSNFPKRRNFHIHKRLLNEIFYKYHSNRKTNVKLIITDFCKNKTLKTYIQKNKELSKYRWRHYTISHKYYTLEQNVHKLIDKLIKYSSILIEKEVCYSVLTIN